MSYFNDAENRLLRYFKDDQYDLYDGVVVQQNAELSIPDIILSVALNSQLDTRNKIWYVWKNKLPIEVALTTISPMIKLEEESIPWKELYVLFETFCQIKYAKEAVATKVLHKKRPSLIPVYDRYVWLHFKNRISRKVWSKGGAQLLMEYMQAFRHELIENREAIYRVQSFAHTHGWSVSTVRVLEVLIWIEYEPTGYYRRGTTGE